MPDQPENNLATFMTRMRGSRLDPARAGQLNGQARSVAAPAAPAPGAPIRSVSGLGSLSAGGAVLPLSAPASAPVPAAAAPAAPVRRLGGLGNFSASGAVPSVKVAGEVAAPAAAAPAAPVRRLGGLGNFSASGAVPSVKVAGEVAAPALVGLGGVLVPPVKKIVYSDQQQAVIEAKGRLVLANAFAGSGKTTTAVGFAEARPNVRMLYVVLNAANAEEARRRFPSYVHCATMHSVALSDPTINAHVNPVIAGRRTSRLDRAWKPMTLMHQFNIRSAPQASHAMKVLQAFFSSTDREIGEKHVEELRQARNLTPSSCDFAVSNALRIWSQMTNPNGTCTMPDDAYLKMFALRSPQLPYAQIIMDEAQDANPVTMQIIGAQQRASLLAIGDHHQSIYAFRGAVNAMERLAVGADCFYLSETYRFGPKIAEVANTILGELKGEREKIIGKGKDGVFDPNKVTYLARTNAQLFAMAADCRGEGMYWVGKAGRDGYQVGRDGPDNYRLKLLEDVTHLYMRERSLIKDPALSRVSTYDEYKSYGNGANDAEAKILCALVDQHGVGTLELVSDIRRNAVKAEADAPMVVATAHKSKGLEWPSVQLCEDFEFLEEHELTMATDANPVVPVQDINLLYVAATRAQSAVKLNGETVQWMQKLPEHREARRLNNERQARGQREAHV